MFMQYYMIQWDHEEEDEPWRLYLEMDSRGSLRRKVEDLRLINRAKVLLIQHLAMTEPEAHRCLEKQAMDQCRTRRSVAEEIIRTYTESAS